MRLGANSLHHTLNLPCRNLDATGVLEVLLGLLVTGLVGSLQTDQPGQRRRVGPLQTQRAIDRVVALLLTRMVVVVPADDKAAKQALHLEPDPCLAMLARLGLVGAVNLISRFLEQKAH